MTNRFNDELVRNLDPLRTIPPKSISTSDANFNKSYEEFHGVTRKLVRDIHKNHIFDSYSVEERNGLTEKFGKALKVFISLYDNARGRIEIDEASEKNIEILLITAKNMDTTLKEMQKYKNPYDAFNMPWELDLKTGLYDPNLNINDFKLSLAKSIIAANNGDEYERLRLELMKLREYRDPDIKLMLEGLKRS